MSRIDNSVSADPSGKAAEVEEQENSLRPARRQAASADPAPELSPKAKKQRSVRRAEPVPVPDEVRKRFVQIKNAYFFADGAKAFTDRGDRLTTPSENTEVVRSLVTIAQARGWSEVVVRGTERFRREAWASARTAGLEVRGYKPTQFEQGRLVRSLATRADAKKPERSTPSSSETTERSSPRTSAERTGEGARSGALLTGTLVEHGRAPYRDDPKAPMSYFVKIETGKGDRTIWGVDLERALTQSLSQPAVGDAVGLRSIRQEAVKVRTAKRDDDGQVVGQKELETHRNHWIVEKQTFFEDRARAARTLRDTSIDPKRGGRQHPELVGTYLQVQAAELAAKQLRDPQDQKRFVEKVREALAASVARGEALPPLRLREQPAPAPQSRATRTHELAHARA